MSRRKGKRKSLQDNHLKLVDVHPMTDNQELFFEKYNSDKSQVMLGYPGTGKTFMAMYKALRDIEDKSNDYNRVIIVRSAVATRDPGFLPGTAADKAAVYELPYKAICRDLFGRSDAYEILKKHGTIEFMSTAFIRGLTLDNCILIIEEVQNMSAHEADSVVTRAGEECKVIICGDILQRDLNKYSEKNIEHMLNVLKKMPDDFEFTYFGEDDVVRSGLVGSYLKAKYKLYPDGFAG
jgi:phosphate starvation-inducible protein PhoH